MSRFALLLGFCLLARVAVAAPVEIGGDLYTGRTIVTGTDQRERLAGFVRCLRDVLVKVSGDPALADDPRIAQDEPAAETLAEDFVYQDRMSDIPTHDEQGTRDRPFDLAVHFVPTKIDAILARIGVSAWRNPRPPLVLLISMARGDDSFPLAADSLADTRPREAAEAAAAKYGMRIVFLSQAAIKAAPSIDGAPLPPIPDAVALRGTLIWSAKDFGWVGHWHLRWQDHDHDWSITGVSFDEAFRDAVRGAMAIVSGAS